MRYNMCGRIAMGLALWGAGCAPTAPKPATVTTEIIRSTEDSAGFYSVTVRITNADTGEIIYNPDHAGDVQALREDRWVTVEPGRIYRTSAKGIAAGTSAAIVIRGQPMQNGEAIRHVFGWSFLEGSSGGEAVSQVVFVR